MGKKSLTVRLAPETWRELHLRLFSQGLSFQQWAARQVEREVAKAKPKETP